MLIRIIEQNRSRHGAMPKTGISNELDLIRSIIMTMAIERQMNKGKVTMEINMEAADAGQLMAIAEALRRSSNDAT